MATRNGKLIYITLEEAVIKALEKLAKEDQRPRNSLIKKIIMEYIGKMENRDEK